MKKFGELLTKEKAAKDVRENNNSDCRRALCRVYGKLGQSFFHNYSLTCLKKDTSVLLSVIKL